MDEATEEDLYGDLDDARAAPTATDAMLTERCTELERTLESERTAAAAAAQTAASELAQLRAQNGVLINNISAIFKTAQARHTIVPAYISLARGTYVVLKTSTIPTKIIHIIKRNLCTQAELARKDQLIAELRSKIAEQQQPQQRTANR